MPELSQAGGEMRRAGSVMRRTRAYPPEDPRSRPGRGDGHAKAPARERMREALGILTAGKTAELTTHPAVEPDERPACTAGCAGDFAACKLPDPAAGLACAVLAVSSGARAGLCREMSGETSAGLPRGLGADCACAAAAARVWWAAGGGAPSVMV